MISSNVSSLMSNQTYMNNSAHNVANVNTEKSQTNLVKELTDQITIEKVAESNAKTIRTQDEMLGSLLDIRG